MINIDKTLATDEKQRCWQCTEYHLTSRRDWNPRKKAWGEKMLLAIGLRGFDGANVRSSIRVKYGPQAPLICPAAC